MQWILFNSRTSFTVGNSPLKRLYIPYITNLIAGYDTMSITTSPGTQSSNEIPRGFSRKESPSPPQIALHPLSSVEEHIDPVALIDARIKVALYIIL